jgi:hypothetical protein
MARPLRKLFYHKLAAYWQRYNTLVLANNITTETASSRESKPAWILPQAGQTKEADEFSYRNAFRIPHFARREQES